MKKFLLSLLALFSFFSVAHAEEEIMSITFPATGGESVNSYTDTWNATVDGNVWVINGFNTNRNGWEFIKCGRKNNDHTASITSPAVDDAVITKVVVAVQKTANVTAASLTILNGVTEVNTIDVTESFAVGNVEIPIEEAVAGYSFKLTIASSGANANGTTWIDGVTLYGNPTAAPSVAKPVIAPATGTYYSEQTVTITAEEGATIFYTLNDGEAAEYTAPFTVSETTTITAYAKKGEDVSGNVTATLTFATTYTTFAAANEAATKDKAAIRLTFTEALVTFVSGQNAYIQDGTGAMLIYGTTTLKAGDKISGNIDGELYTYNGLPEVASPTLDVEVVSSDNEVVPTAVSAADLAANPMKYISQYVVVSDAVFADDIAETAPGKANNFNFTVGETTLILRNNFKVDLAATAGTLYKVAGFVTVYNTNVQLYPRTDQPGLLLDDSRRSRRSDLCQGSAGRRRDQWCSACRGLDNHIEW